VSACGLIKVRSRSKESCVYPGDFTGVDVKGFGRLRASGVGHATGCQRPLAVVQRAGTTLMQANADGEPGTVLVWLKSVVTCREARTSRSKYS
jgi:hypothetical protein